MVLSTSIATPPWVLPMLAWRGRMEPTHPMAYLPVRLISVILNKSMVNHAWVQYPTHSADTSRHLLWLGSFFLHLNVIRNTWNASLNITRYLGNIRLLLIPQWYYLGNRLYNSYLIVIYSYIIVLSDDCYCFAHWYLV